VTLCTCDYDLRIKYNRAFTAVLLCSERMNGKKAEMNLEVIGAVCCT